MFQRSVIGKVVSTHRLTSSKNGNPRFNVTLDNGFTYQTAVDSGLAYEIQNLEFREIDHEFDVSARGRFSGYYRRA